GGPDRTLAQWNSHGLGDDWRIDPSGEWLQFVQGDRVLRLRLKAPQEPPKLIGRHPGQKIVVFSLPQSDRVATGDERGEVRIWDGRSGRLERTLKSPADARRVTFDPRARYLAASSNEPTHGPSTFIFDLKAPRYAEPVPLLDPEPRLGPAFDPRGQWAAAGSLRATVLWNLAGKRSTVLGGQKPTGGTPSSIGGIVGVNVAFTRDGPLVPTWEKGVRVWPLPGTDEDVRDVRLPSTAWPFEYLTVGARWRFGAVTERVAGRVITFPLDGSPPAVHALEQAYPR